MKRIKRLMKAIVILGLLFPAAALGETITLKSGKRIEGKIMEKTDQYLKIESGGMPIYYELKYIQNIEEDIAAMDANAYLKEGLKSAAEMRLNEAKETFKKGLALNSADYNLQEALKMITDLEKGVISQDYALYLFKGSDYLMQAQYEQATTEFKKALAMKPNEADLNYYLGVCYYFLEQYPEATTYLKKALQIKPDDEIYYYLGVSSYSQGQFQEAITYLKETLKAHPDDAEVYSIIGTSYYLLGQLQEAKENLSKAKELFKKEGDYLKAMDIEGFLKEKLDRE